MKISGIYKGTVISDEELHQIEIFAKKNRLKLFIEKDFYSQKTNVYIVLRNIVYDMEGVDINNNYVIKEMMNEFHFIQINNNKYRIERSIENLLVLSSSDDDDGIDYVNQQIQKIEDEKESQTKQLKKQFKKESKEKKNENNTEEKTEKRKRGRPKKK